jgi:VWFA-related protein
VYREITMRKLLAVVSLFVTAAAVYAQQPRAAETVQVTVVEVPVTVSDRGGNAIRGLTKENFEVTDDGKKVPIEYFEVLDLPTLTAEAEASQSTPLPPAATRHFLLLFDLANSSPGTIGRAAGAAKQFIESQLGDRDLAAVATFSTEKGARMITNFTRNRTLLVNAIETLGNPAYFKVADPLMISALRAGNDITAPGGESGSGAAGAAEKAAEEMAKESAVQAGKIRDNELRDRLRIQLANMGNLVRALDRISGQKQVILLSEGFDASLVHGRENLTSASARQEDASVLSGETWNVDSDQRFGNAAAANDVDMMTQLFRRSDVVLHAIDIKGLRGSSDVTTADGTAGKSNEGLFLITAPTGGTVFKNGNDLKANFGRLLKQQEVVYVLGFQSRASGKPGKFHALKVKVVNARADKVTARAGYYEQSNMSDLERVLTVADVLMTDAPVDDIAVKVTATPLPGPNGRARVPVVVEIPGSRLLQNIPGKTASAEIFLYAFDKNSQVMDHLKEKVTLDLTKAGEQIKNGGVRYYGTLRLPAGDYAVKSVVRVEESGLMGFTRSDVNVPAFSGSTVVGPVVAAEPGNWGLIVGPSRGDDYPYPFTAGESRYIPQRNVQVSPTNTYRVALFLVGVPLENLGLTPTITSEGGATKQADVKLVGRTAPDDRGVFQLFFDFKPGTLASGQHQLKFDVKSKDGAQSVVSLPFVVQ